MNTFDLFASNKGRITSKYLNYFPVYDLHLQKYANSHITFFEIGVRYGGSLALWKRFFGPHSRIVGIDIDDQCKCIEDPEQGIFVEIGSQSDSKFLENLISKYGLPSAIIDDGSHRTEDISFTFDFLFPKLQSNSVYIVEDLHTCYWDEYTKGTSENKIFTNRMKGFIDQLHHRHLRTNNNPLETTTKNLSSMHIYDSIAVFEKLDHINKSPFITGQNSPEELNKLNPKLRRQFNR